MSEFIGNVIKEKDIFPDVVSFKDTKDLAPAVSFIGDAKCIISRVQGLPVNGVRTWFDVLYLVDRKILCKCEHPRVMCYKGGSCKCGRYTRLCGVRMYPHALAAYDSGDLTEITCEIRNGYANELLAWSTDMRTWMTRGVCGRNEDVYLGIQEIVKKRTISGELKKRVLPNVPLFCHAYRSASSVSN